MNAHYRWTVAAALALAIGCGGKQADPQGPMRVDRAASDDDATPEQPTGWEAAGIDWSQPPPPLPEPVFSPPSPTELRLKNGLRVLVVENHRLPLVSLALVNPRAGATYDPRGKAGLAYMVADLLDEGAGTRDAVALAAELERLGATLSVSVDHDAAYVELSTLSRTLDDSLALLADVVARPAFRRADVARIQGEQLADVKRRVDEPYAVAALAMRQALYGRDGVYGQPIVGHAETVARLSRGDVTRFYQQHWAPDVATLVIAGDADAAAIAARLEASLGAVWKGKARAGKPRAPTPVPEPPRIVLVDKDDAAQSVVFVSRVGLARTDPRYWAAEVADTALGGSFSARLNNRLREQLGYTYGARSSFDYGIAAGPWSAASALFSQKTLAGVAEMLALIGGVGRAPLPDDELSRARELLIRSVPREFASNAGTAEAFADLALYGLPLDWYATYAERVGSVDAAQAQAVAAELLGGDDLLVVVVGDLDALRDELLGLGLRPAVELDATGKRLKTH